MQSEAEKDKKISKDEDKDEKPSKNSPSYLIWSIFTKQRELEKARILQGKVATSFGNGEFTPSKLTPDRGREKAACN